MKLTSIIPAGAKTTEELHTMMIRQMAFLIDTLRDELKIANQANNCMEKMLQAIRKHVEISTSDYIEGDVLRISAFYPDDDGYQDLLGYFSEGI